MKHPSETEGAGMRLESQAGVGVVSQSLCIRPLNLSNPIGLGPHSYDLI